MSASLVLRTRTADGTRAIARTLATVLAPGDLLILDGPLGAGKTTFTQGLGEGLGVRGPVASPTFVIERIHPSLADGPALAHVDAYRLAGAGDLDDLDLEADLDHAVTVVEWGRDRAEHLADSHLLNELERPGQVEDPEDPDEPRRLVLTGHGARWDEQARTHLAAALRAGGHEIAEPGADAQDPPGIHQDHHQHNHQDTHQDPEQGPEQTEETP